MTKNRDTTGFSGQKVDNFCLLTNVGLCQGEVAEFWRDTLQNGLIKETPQLFILLFA
jgi:hypothetical protein